MSATPILNNLLMTGVVITDHMQYLGIASDNALCVLPGSTDRPDQTETYLTDFPTPDMW